MEPESGKGIFVLGVMELLSRRIRNIGFFRPVIKSSDTPDNDIQLILSQKGNTMNSLRTSSANIKGLKANALLFCVKARTSPVSPQPSSSTSMPTWRITWGRRSWRW
jgi:hypothetical protein